MEGGTMLRATTAIALAAAEISLAGYVAFLALVIAMLPADDGWAFGATDLDWVLGALERTGFGVVTTAVFLLVSIPANRFARRLKIWTLSNRLLFGLAAVPIATSLCGGALFLVLRPYT